MLWGLGPVHAQATYGVAVERLRRQIHSGLLLPAEKLPAERQLSDSFRISRVSLREALRVLETETYITVKRGAQGGTFVADADNLTRLSTRRIVRSPGDTMRVLEFLCANELASVEYAATRRELPELKRMRQALAMMRAAETMPHLKQAETFFHMALGPAAKNVHLSRAIEDGLAELFLPWPPADLAGHRARMITAHSALLDAIEGRHPTDAISRMRAIHETYWQSVRELTRSAA